MWVLVISVLVQGCLTIESAQLYDPPNVNYGFSLPVRTLPKVVSKQDCVRVSQEMVAMGISYPQMEGFPIPAVNKMVCRAQRSLTCCSTITESKLLHRAKNEFSNVYTDIFQRNITSLVETKKKLKKFFREIATRSFSSINATLSRALPSLYSATGDRLAHDLLYDLLLYLADPGSSHMEINSRIALFFDRLFSRLACSLVADSSFPSASRSSTFNLGSSWPPENCQVEQCAIPNVFHVWPGLGPRAALANSHLTAALRLVRGVMNGLDIIIHILKTLSRNVLDSTCYDSLLQLRHCSLCAGVTNIQACKTYCFSVVQQCIAPFKDVFFYWKQFMPLLQQAIAKVNSHQNFLDLLVQFPSSIVDILNAFKSDQGQIQARILSLCQSRTSSLTTHSPPSVLPATSKQDFVSPTQMPQEELRSTLNFLFDQLSYLRLFFTDLNSIICERPEMAAHLAVIDNCWNGSAVAKYVPNLSDVVDPTPPISPTAFSLLSTLDQMIRSLTTTLKGSSPHHWVIPEPVPLPGDLPGYRDNESRNKGNNRRKPINLGSTDGGRRKNPEGPKKRRKKKKKGQNSAMNPDATSFPLLPSFGVPEMGSGGWKGNPPGVNSPNIPFFPPSSKNYNNIPMLPDVGDGTPRDEEPTKVKPVVIPNDRMGSGEQPKWSYNLPNSFPGSGYGPVDIQPPVPPIDDIEAEREPFSSNPLVPPDSSQNEKSPPPTGGQSAQPRTEKDDRCRGDDCESSAVSLRDFHGNRKWRHLLLASTLCLLAWQLRHPL